MVWAWAFGKLVSWEGPCCSLAFSEGPDCSSVLEASVASPVGNLVAGKKALEDHRLDEAALGALDGERSWAWEAEACSLAVLVWGHSWAFAWAVVRSWALALEVEEHSWDEVLEAEVADDIVASEA